MDAADEEMASALLLSLQQLAEKLEQAQQASGARTGKAPAAPAVAQVLQEFGPTGSAPPHAPARSLMAAQLALVGKVFPQLQEQARQLVEPPHGRAV